MKKLKIPYDKLWKIAVTENAPDFIAMFMPELQEQIDYNVEFKFLEQELQSVSVNKTMKSADKLICVTLKSGLEKWVYIHVEFETSPRGNWFCERMFDYYFRIREQYGKEITAIVIYTGSYVPKIYDFYEYEAFGTTLTYRFNAYIIKEQSEADLIANQNPFAIVVLANLYVLQSKNDDLKRLTLKEQIYKIAKERNYSNDKVESLILFLSELIKLPFDLETKFTEYISKPSKSTDMPYISQTSLNMADHIAKKAYGISVAEMDSTIVNTIVQLFAQLNMTIEQIAEFTKLDVQFVQDTLKKKKLLKKKKP